MPQSSPDRYRIAVLDDYQDVAMRMADWSPLRARADITVFNDHLADRPSLIHRLAPFHILCVMRERTPLPRAVLEQLPHLRLIASTARRNAAIDTEAARERRIDVLHTGYLFAPTVEATWALILASARNIVGEAQSMRSGGWQRHIGADLQGRTLGLLGLGGIGSAVARIGQAFGMETIAWSQNLTSEHAASMGTRRVSREDLFRQADFLSIHLVLSERTLGIVGAAELDLMKPTAHLVNTSRGPLVVERDLIQALNRGRPAAAALDVYDLEPPVADHPLRHLPQVLATPHIGGVTQAMYRRFYQDTVDNIKDWLDKVPPAPSG